MENVLSKCESSKSLSPEEIGNIVKLVRKAAQNNAAAGLTGIVKHKDYDKWVS